MSGRLHKKVAVVTGAGSGMGRAMAEMFAVEGAHVICADISGQQDEVARSIGNGAVAVHANVTVQDDVRNMIATAESFGRLDILCNNAGDSGPLGLMFHEQDETAYDRVMDVNLRGTYYGMRYGIISMLKTGGGSIINTASASALVGWRWLGCYAASKAAVVQLTKSAALDYADKNIRINAICPGKIWTGMNPNAKGSRRPPADAAALDDVPMKRWGLDRDIAAAALYLASDDAAYVTGIALPVDGGYVAG